MQFGNPFSQESSDDDDNLDLAKAAKVHARYGGIGENFCRDMALTLEAQINSTFGEIEAQLNNELGPMFVALGLGHLRVQVESDVTLTFDKDMDE
jgi:hypothetical protein